MIRLAAVVLVSFCLSFGTIWANDIRQSEDGCLDGLAVLCEEVEVEEGGFPIQFKTQVEDSERPDETLSSFDVGAFTLNWLVWIGITSILYLVASTILKYLGKAALIVYLVATFLGYSISVGAWF